MLEDEKWLQQFISRNQGLLAEHYAVTTQFLRERRLAFFENT
jgi:hypothetical protein